MNIPASTHESRVDRLAVSGMGTNPFLYMRCRPPGYVIVAMLPRTEEIHFDHHDDDEHAAAQPWRIGQSPARIRA
jgi:hypothetical protein